MKKQNEKREAAKSRKGAARGMADGAAIDRTRKGKAAAAFVVGTAGKSRKGMTAKDRYAGMTDAQVAEQAELLLRATKKIVTGALKFAAVEIGTMLAQVTRNDGADVRATCRVGEADYMARELLAKWENELDLLA